MYGSVATLNSKLRILQVVSAYYPAVRYGGPIRSVHGLSVALARRGHDVHVYTTTLDGASDLDVPVDQPMDLEGVRVHYFRVPMCRRLAWAPGLKARLRESIRDFDAVHIHAVYLWPMVAAAREAARAGIPYVMAPRGMLIREAINRKSRWTKTAWIHLLERKSLANASAVHVTADIEAAELRSLGLPAPHVTCIPNGVEAPREFESLSAGPFRDLPQSYVLFLSRINWKKGLDRLITAWQSLRGVPLVIAGNDEDGYENKLKEQVRSMGLTETIRFLGPIEDAHKWALYKEARLFVLPSYTENFGNVVAEAMAMGCPVAVTPEVGIASMVRATGAGIVVDGAPREFSRAVSALLADPARLRDMASRGRTAARELLSWDAVAASAETLYREVIDERLTPEPVRAEQPT